MGFETVVLNQVAEILGNPHQAEFTSGTLFVGQLSMAEALKLKIQLGDISRYKIQMNQVGSEFAFDFV